MNRKITHIFQAKTTREGAGVRLKRVFGYHQLPLFDPFLLLDHFGSDDPADYLAGFPDHPHRGIETVTYMWHGSVQHKDSLGNGGIISDGDVQWMSAGSGIIHSEMPMHTEGRMQGFQLWLNLPATKKMLPPRYRDVAAKAIPSVDLGYGIKAKIICGTINGVDGPVQDIETTPLYIDLSIPANSEITVPIPAGHTSFCYIVTGQLSIGSKENKPVIEEQVALLDKRGDLTLFTNQTDCQLLLIAGKPINEPIAWHGPIVMNTQGELDIAFKEYQEGTFIKK